MTIEYRPFDAGAGANVTEDGWRAMARHWLRTGVLAGEADEFAVSERGAGANMSVDVAAGEAWLQGHHVESDAVENLPISEADATDDRIDRIVLRADFVENTVSLEVLEGTPDPAPVAPSLTQSAARWEISLAQVLVEALTVSILDADVTDERQLVTPHPLIVTETAELDVVSSAAEETFYRAIIPGGLLGAHGMARLTILFEFFNNSGADRVITVRVKHGTVGSPTEIYDDASAPLGTSAVRRAGALEICLANVGSESEQFMNGRVHFGAGVADTGFGGLDNTGIAVFQRIMSPTPNPAADTSADTELLVTVDHSASDAALSVLRKYVLLELIPRH